MPLEKKTAPIDDGRSGVLDEKNLYTVRSFHLTDNGAIQHVGVYKR